MPHAVQSAGGAFNATNFKGTYVISITGTDLNAGAGTASFFAIVGTITADGSGNITAGTVDINDPDIGGFAAGQAVSASKYTITPDGRGTGTLVTPVGSFGLDFVLTSGGHGLITRFDGSGSGSGTLDIQGAASQSSLTAVAFTLSGSDATSSFAVGSVGAASLDSSGVITAGTQDFNEGGSSAGLSDLTLSGSVVLTSSTNGTAVLSTSGILGTLNFDVWVVDSTHLKLIETDAAAVLAGDAYTQTSTSIPAGTLVFTISGGDSSNPAAPFVAGGLMTTDAGGTITSGLEDFNDAGTAFTVPSFTGSCTSTNAVGRCQWALAGFSNGILQAFQFAAYPSSAGTLLLEVDSFGQTQGAAYLQSATAFSPDGYGLNLSGSNVSGEVDDIAQFNATSATSNNLSGLLDENDLGGPLAPASLSGTYTPDSPATGRGMITIPSLNTSIGTLNLEYYVIDGSTIAFIEVDTAQVGVGIFQLQSVSTSPGVAQPAIPMVRPISKMFAASRRKAATTVQPRRGSM